jgi:hypothetical protein
MCKAGRSLLAESVAHAIGVVCSQAIRLGIL